MGVGVTLRARQEDVRVQVDDIANGLFGGWFQDDSGVCGRRRGLRILR
jgi:hypothetical protein